MDKLSVKCLLYTDDQIIFAACGLQNMINKINDSVKKKVIKANVGKTKMMVFERGESVTECEKIEQMKKFVYLVRMFTNDGKHERDIERRVNAGNKENGTLLAIMNSKGVSRQARLPLHNGILIPTLMYGSENWVW
ncbi:hypothetical protein EVAR_66301_1 [Eumeta japonica]|uniref:Reverse transcriptase domain-containing protein n=1 Tax=Eumeta variegata TaxID=151549 RepID=A0A4C1ZAW3_EUMVA|nr:hypothetical protein EVAR_66301_1 [Eumeta japonica]